MGQRLGARAEAEGRNELGLRVAGDPQLGGLGHPTQLEAQLVDLDVGQVQRPQHAVLHQLSTIQKLLRE